jgi:hypothetical protein
LLELTLQRGFYLLSPAVLIAVALMTAAAFSTRKRYTAVAQSDRCTVRERYFDPRPVVVFVAEAQPFIE